MTSSILNLCPLEIEVSCFSLHLNWRHIKPNYALCTGRITGDFNSVDLRGSAAMSRIGFITSIMSGRGEAEDAM
jgi:hypothetical protein